MCLSKNTSERAARDFAVIRDCSSDETVLYRFSEFHMAARLSGLIEARFQKFAAEFAVRDRLHAAISNSK